MENFILVLETAQGWYYAALLIVQLFEDLFLIALHRYRPHMAQYSNVQLPGDCYISLTISSSHDKGVYGSYNQTIRV